MIKCLIFDLDGTLINTLNDLKVTASEILDEFGYSSNLDLDTVRYFVGNGMKKFVERFLTYANGDLSLLDTIYDKFVYEYNNKCLRFASLYEGINELIDKLKNKGYILYVNTNKNHEIANRMINELLPNTFINVYGDSTNFPRKPDPYIVNKIKEVHNLVNEEIMYIGDSNVDVLTGHNAGVQVIGCSYGFRGEKELKEIGADYLINSPLEILKIINY